MTNLISGKEALIALANGEEVENWNGSVWWDVDKTWQVGAFMAGRKFRLKPRTITINGIEVPAPFEPKNGDWVYFLNDDQPTGYSKIRKLNVYDFKLGAWRTEEEIKQVVAALRQIFGRSDDAVNAVRGGK